MQRPHGGLTPEQSFSASMNSQGKFNHKQALTPEKGTRLESPSYRSKTFSFLKEAKLLWQVQEALVAAHSQVLNAVFFLKSTKKPVPQLNSSHDSMNESPFGSGLPSHETEQ